MNSKIVATVNDHEIKEITPDMIDTLTFQDASGIYMDGERYDSVEEAAAAALEKDK